MPSLVDSLSSAAHSLNSYEQAMQVVSNDTTNSATPGYANQDPNFLADSFNPSGGGAGGVTMAGLLSSRDEYAEQTVQAAQSSESFSALMATNLQSVEGLFPLAASSSSSTSDNGISGKLNDLFSAFSSLTTTPNDTASRQSVLNAAQNLATVFNETYTGLTTAKQNALSQGIAYVQQINSLVAQIQQINVAKQKQASALTDPGLDAQLHSDLENLSQLVNITTQTASDGTTSIFLGGRSLLLMGAEQYTISTTTVSGNLQVLDGNGNNIAGFATSGKLGALVTLANKTIPGYISQLNTLSRNIADTINSTLTSGVDQNGNPGVAMFSYNPISPAQTLSVSMTDSSTIAAATAADPGGNDNAVTLSTLDTKPQTGLGGFTFTSYYGNLASLVGTDSSKAQSDQTTNQQVLTQSQTLRSNLSGVSLDQEATELVEYQQAFDATSKLVNAIDQMMQTLINMYPATA
jgi:flagellar hook-associated protein 1 FlgK